LSGFNEKEEGFMVRGCFLALFAGLVLASAASAQAGRFAWKAGQILVYRIEQVTSESEVDEGNKAETGSKLNTVKCWKILDVDAAGTATLQLWINSLRYERTAPGGEVLVFDSAEPDKSTPAMREQMASFVGQTLAVLRIDNKGKVVEVKQCKKGSASQYESSPPFAVVLPEEGLRAGQTWERTYAITVEPPLGAGEKYDASQKYDCKAIEGGTASISLTTTPKTLPMALGDQIPLLDKQVEGEVVFDTEAGLLRSVRLHVDKELKNHKGEGSSFRFQSTYTEQQVAVK
jgi:hypothetical protein